MRDDEKPATDPTDALLRRLDDIGEERGSFERLGPGHASLFVDESPAVLLVTFERADRLAARGGQPLGLSIADRHGWSQLCILSRGETGWRDPLVWRYFDRLVDDGFFEDFDRVVFYGAELAGYAAAAFSVAAPGATVLAVSPRATLDPARAGWDRRHPGLRRSDFRTRYGYAPQMVEGAAQVLVLHDPWIVEDAMHASLFIADHVEHLGCAGLGPDPEARLDEARALVPLIEAACAGSLSAATAARAWRGRRGSPAWLRALLDRAEERGRPGLALRACRFAVDRTGAQAFRRHLDRLEALNGPRPDDPPARQSGAA